MATTPNPMAVTNTAAQVYTEAHAAPDTDQSPLSIHHTLGKGGGNASPGNHNHRKNPGYTIPALENSWVDYGATWDYRGFTRNDAGWVCGAGLIKNGTFSVGILLLTLPVGYRPVGDMHILAACNATWVVLNVLRNGEVKINTLGGGSNAWLSLDQVAFQAA